MVKHNITPTLKNITLNLTNIKSHLTGIQKIIISSSIIITLSLLNITHTSALTYSDNVNMQFTFNPTISIDITGDLSIDELVPGGYSDSNIVNVNVATNNSNGYYLSANVGSSTNNPSTELRLSNYNANDGSNGSTNPIFTSLLTNDSYTSFSDSNIAYNTWGYSYSLDGTNWSNYSGLPLYNTAGIKLKENYSPSNDTINFKIAAKASNTQVSGAYTNTINFIATTHPSPMTIADAYAYYNKSKVNGYYTMQDMDADICKIATEGSSQLIDTRDNNIYEVAKMRGGDCLMVQNLRYVGGNNGVVSEGNAINSKGNEFTMVSSVSETYTAPRYYKSNNDNYGVYYNYCAATGNTICAESWTLPQVSICPIGWILPAMNTNSVFGKTAITTLKDSGYFDVYAGYYNGGSLKYSGTRGYWWSSSPISKDVKYNLWYNGTTMNRDSTIMGRLMSVRCVFGG